MLHIFIDADACPVKQEVFRVAARHDLRVTLVAGSWMRAPGGDKIAVQIVEQGPEAADDWIVDHVGTDDIVITADIPLAARCLKKNASVLGPTGKPFTDENIGQALATRDLLTGLREQGQTLGGPSPFGKQDRSRFLQRLEETIRAIRRKHPPQ